MAVLKNKMGFPGLTGRVAVVNFCNEKFEKSESVVISAGELVLSPCQIFPVVKAADLISINLGLPVTGEIKGSAKLAFFIFLSYACDVFLFQILQNLSRFLPLQILFLGKPYYTQLAIQPAIM